MAADDFEHIDLARELIDYYTVDTTYDSSDDDYCIIADSTILHKSRSSKDISLHTIYAYKTQISKIDCLKVGFHSGSYIKLRSRYSTAYPDFDDRCVFFVKFTHAREIEKYLKQINKANRITFTKSKTLSEHYKITLKQLVEQIIDWHRINLYKEIRIDNLIEKDG